LEQIPTLVNWMSKTLGRITEKETSHLTFVAEMRSLK